MAASTIQPTPQIRMLAQHALRAMDQTATYQEGRGQADSFLGDPDAATGTLVEKAVISATRSATGKRLSSESAYKTQEAAFRALAAGVGGSVGQALGKLGIDAVDVATDWEDARAMGGAYLDGIESASPSADEQALAAAASGATGHRLTNESAGKTMRAAFELLADGSLDPLDQRLARLGTRAVDAATDWEDARAMGNSVLDALHAPPASPTEALLVDAARDAVDRRLANESAAHAQTAAFGRVASAAAGAPEKLLGEYGADVIDGATDWEDAYNMGLAVLQRLGKGCTVAGVSQVVEMGCAQADAARTYEAGVGCIRQAFDAAGQIAGLFLAPSPSTAPGAGQQAVLESHLQQSQTALKTVQDRIQADSHTLSGLQTQTAALAGQAQPLLDSQKLATRHLKIASAIVAGGAVGAGGGLLTLVLHLPPVVYAPLFAGGAALLGVGAFQAARAQRRRAAASVQMLPLSAQISGLATQADAVQTRLGYSHAVEDGLQQAIQSDQGKLDVYRMAATPSASQPGPGKVEVQPTVVKLGDVVVPKNVADQPGRLPASSAS